MTINVTEYANYTRAKFKREAAEGIDTKKGHKSYPVGGLLTTPVANPKIAKNMKEGVEVMTVALHLAPYDLGGYQVCPNATKGCAAACLHTAGNPIYMENKGRARSIRTQLFFEKRNFFVAWLIEELTQYVVKAEKEGVKLGCRLNATSDFPWETLKINHGAREAATIFELFPEVEFYDYTKRPKRNVSHIPNYSLTFSLAEDNDADAIKALERGMNVAVVFDTKRNKPLPQFMQQIRHISTPKQNLLKAGGIPGATKESAQWPVIDGDEHDFRPIDPKGVIVGLRAKGDAIGDESGFVRVGG